MSSLGAQPGKGRRALGQARARSAASLALALAIHGGLIGLLVLRAAAPTTRPATGRSSLVSLVSLDGFGGAVPRPPMLTVLPVAPAAPPAAAQAEDELTIQVTAREVGTVPIEPAERKADQPSNAAADASKAATAPSAYQIDAQLTANPGGAAECNLEGAVQAALRQSPEAQVAASGWPKTAPTAAVSLWNGRWIDSEVLGGGDTVEPIQRLVLATLQTASPECLVRPVEGARAFRVALPGPPGAPTPVQVAFSIGGDLWRWRELIQTSGGSVSGL